MTHSSWNFTRYEDGVPVSTETNLNHEQAAAVIRAAMTGAATVTELSSKRQDVNPDIPVLSQAA